MAFEPDPAPGEIVRFRETTDPRDFFGIAVSDRAVYVSKRRRFAWVDALSTVRIALADVRIVRAMRLRSIGVRVFMAVMFGLVAVLLVWQIDGGAKPVAIVGGLALLVTTGLTLPLALAQRYGLCVELVDGTRYWWRPLPFTAHDRRRNRSFLLRVVGAAQDAGIDTAFDP